MIARSPKKGFEQWKGLFVNLISINVSELEPSSRAVLAGKRVLRCLAMQNLEGERLRVEIFPRESKPRNHVGTSKPATTILYMADQYNWKAIFIHYSDKRCGEARLELVGEFVSGSKRRIFDLPKLRTNKVCVDT